MNLPRRLILATLAGLAAIPLACTEQGTEPDPGSTTPASVVRLGGDDQMGTVGAELGQALVVQVLSESGEGVGGVTVTWTVVAGGGTLSASSVTTSSEGLAQTRWTLGTAAGENLATAAVGSLPEAPFSATGTPDDPATVEVSPGHLDFDALGVTAILALSVTDRFGNAVSGYQAVWSSSDSAVARPDATGVITSGAAGEALITARVDTATGEATVLVDPSPVSVTISPAADTANAIGDTVALSAAVRDRNGSELGSGDLSWESLDPAVATVGSDGAAVSVGTGVARIVAAAGGATDTMLLTVRQVVASVAVSPAAPTVLEGETLRLGAAAADSNGVAVEGAAFMWTSSDDAVLTVDQDGLAHAVGEGAATATATTAEVAGGTTVTVDPNQAPVAAAGADQDAALGGSVVLDGGGSTDPEARSLTYTWTQVHGPDVTGGTGTLTGVAPTFEAPAEVSTVVFELLVTDGVKQSTADPVQINILVDPARALFVSPSGTDLNPGTRGAPYRSIQFALDRIAAQGGAGEVYVAAGTYVQSLTLVDSAGIYGGFAADTWVRDLDQHVALVDGGTTAVRGTAVEGITIDGMTIRSDSVAAGSYGVSSYGVFLTSATGAVLSNNRITAGTGGSGSLGPNGSTGSSGSNGANGAVGSCDSSTVASGGGGGYGGNSGGAGGSGRYATSGLSGAKGGGSGGGAGGAGGAAGEEGANGSNGSTGLTGATGMSGAGGGSFGSFWGTGYVAANGSGGTTGTAGGGGGGGGAGGGQTGTWVLDGTGNGGGGGGGGGFGGSGGGGGGGGGGSFGVVLHASTGVLLAGNEITTVTGGAGGGAGSGGMGGSGGWPGNGGSTCTGEVGAGGQGGRGGAGGNGGRGGGGGGGPSIGVLYSSGSSFDSVGNTIVVGTGGPGGYGASTGATGVSSATHQGG